MLVRHITTLNHSWSEALKSSFLHSDSTGIWLDLNSTCILLSEFTPSVEAKYTPFICSDRYSELLQYSGPAYY